MNDALTYIYYIFAKFNNFVFNEALIAQNVSIGWIAIVVMVFSITISSILNLPRGMDSFSKFREHAYDTSVYGPNGHVRTYTTYKKRRY